MAKNINRENYEAYLIDYLHGELSAEDILAMEKFISANADVQEEFALLQKTILSADEAVVFENKKSLLKPESNNIFILYKKYIAVAAVVSGIIISIFFMMKKRNPYLLVQFQ